MFKGGYKIMAKKKNLFICGTPNTVLRILIGALEEYYNVFL